MGVYVLKRKSEVFDRFKWKALVENASGKKLKVLRTDEGGEYTCVTSSSSSSCH